MQLLRCGPRTTRRRATYQNESRLDHAHELDQRRSYRRRRRAGAPLPKDRPARGPRADCRSGCRALTRSRLEETCLSSPESLRGQRSKDPLCPMARWDRAGTIAESRRAVSARRECRKRRKKQRAKSGSEIARVGVSRHSARDVGDRPHHRRGLVGRGCCGRPVVLQLVLTAHGRPSEVAR